VSGTDPAVIVEDKERIHELIDSLTGIMQQLDMEDRDIFFRYIFERQSVRDISLSLEMPRMNVWRRLQKIFDFIAANAGQDTFLGGIRREALLPLSVGYKQQGSKHVGFPFELAKESNDGGEWTIINGYRRYKTNKKCRLKQYIKNAFGDQEVECPYCRRCKGGEEDTAISESGEQTPDSEHELRASVTNRRRAHGRSRVSRESVQREAV
jgi:hypothetical protein